MLVLQVMVKNKLHAKYEQIKNNSSKKIGIPCNIWHQFDSMAVVFKFNWGVVSQVLNWQSILKCWMKLMCSIWLWDPWSSIFTAHKCVTTLRLHLHVLAHEMTL